MTGSPSTTNSSGTEGQTTSTGSSTGDTGGPSTHAICDRYLACISAAAPGELPAAQMGFGQNGTCWQGSENDAQLCLDACEAGLETFNEAFPDEPKCALCQDHTECDADAGELCDQGKCTVTTCSDGVVDAEEVCDSQPGYDADCLGPSECNPFSNFGCSESNTCAIQPMYTFDEITLARCLSYPEWFFALEGDPCQDFGPDPTVCDLGLGCASPALLPDCDPGMGKGCCTPLCTLDDPQQCSVNEKCVPYQDASGYILAPELTYLGMCVPK
ncbi:hypothetical protein SAMN02745121_01922 [Nannocystis exedens]|uniref:Uncharacterized protein n=1 Tax=Nannocystis exedens TaxID=54 RepID=A0A1I1VSX8_9BACT|nr:hypothetical protein NAEX_05889 [Nannocystis exedens]SFD85934.1 hypothetical protein SAMN02745121_01922 [Nannocystis exedens]